LQGFFGIFGTFNQVAVFEEPVVQGIPDRFFIINNKYVYLLAMPVSI